MIIARFDLGTAAITANVLASENRIFSPKEIASPSRAVSQRKIASSFLQKRAREIITSE